jgi:hypothetical protein
MKTRNIQVVDLDVLGKQLPQKFLFRLVEEINNSDISWGSNDDTLVRIDNFISIVEEALESSDSLTRDETLDVEKLVSDLHMLDENIMVSLGS